MKRTVSLRNLVKRIETDEQFLRTYPENAEMLKNRIEKHKENIIQCVLENKDNLLLEEIVMK